MKMLIALIFSFIFASLAFAQEANIGEALNFLQYAIQQLGGMKGASAYVIAGIIVQVLLKLVNAKFIVMKGSQKLTIVLALTYLSGVLSLVTVGGLGLGQAFVHSSSLSAFLVLLNQIYKQYFIKHD